MSESSTAWRYRLHDLPGPKPLPLLGNMHQINPRQFHLDLERWAREFGPAYKIHISGKPTLVLADPAFFSTLLRDRPEGFRRAADMEQIIEESGIKGLFTAGGEDWKMQRKLVMRAFTPEVVRRFFPQLQAMLLRLRLYWLRAAQSGQTIDLMRDLKLFALDITIAFTYGQDINSVEELNSPMRYDIDSLFETVARRMTNPIRYWRYFRLPADYRFEAALARVEQKVAGYIEQCRRLLHEQPERRLKPANLMEALLVARDEPGSGFNDSHVSGNAMTMVFAGEDTTANSTAWLVYLLAGAPQVVQQIRAELDPLFGDGATLPDYSMLQQLPWLDAALNESMRLKPVASWLPLESLHEMVVGDTLVAAATPVFVLTRSAGMQAQIFPEPEQFLPQRWLDGAEPDLIKKMFPFGGGPRLCPGRFLALAEMKMIISMLLKNFDIHLQDGAKVEETFVFTIAPSCLPVKLTQRR